jgi:hypothetical protein
MKQIYLTFGVLLLAMVAGYLLGSLKASAHKLQPAVELHVTESPFLSNYPKNPDTDAAYSDGFVQGTRQENPDTATIYASGFTNGTRQERQRRGEIEK